MTQISDSYKSQMLLSLFIGAAAGALLVALNTHKTDLELQRHAPGHHRNVPDFENLG